ncbi:MAG: C-GCAxxG-C-C family (seleno)protein [Victivallaceae bacterium]
MTKASDKFHGAENYNCAQAVLKFMDEQVTVSSELLEQFKQFGGGRAPAGICGALYAASYILKNEKLTGELEKLFEDTACSKCCREIKTAGRLSCAGCVDLAADFCSDKLKK